MASVLYSSNFMSAMDIILRWEGNVLEHDPDDPGSTTCCGISFAAYPKWEGWDLITTSGIQISHKVFTGTELMDCVYKFYHELWDKYKLDDYPYIVAMEMFDQIINPGPAVMGRNAQTTLNNLNYNQKYGQDLDVDGAFGAKSKYRLHQVVQDGRQQAFATAMNCLQGSYYSSLAEKYSYKRKWFAGWLSRCAAK